MSLKQRIDGDTKAALLGGDRFVGEVLRNLRGSLLSEEVDQNKRDTGLTDDEIEKVIAREVKKRRESLALYRDNNRDDLADNEQREIDVLAVYLPEPLNEAAIRTMAEEAVASTGATGPQDMGKVIGAVKAKAGSAADGATVARIVKELLAGR